MPPTTVWEFRPLCVHLPGSSVLTLDRGGFEEDNTKKKRILTNMSLEPLVFYTPHICFMADNYIIDDA